MSLFDIIAILLTVVAVFSYLNHCFFKLPSVIGLMLASLGFSCLLILSESLGLGLKVPAQKILEHIDFNAALLHGMLSFLLFAGALHVNMDDLLKQKWIIALTATVGVLLCTVIVGGLTWGLLQVFGLNISFLYCLLFGALISPTDPIAVLGILKRAGASRSISTKITGESLFNDGFGVVIFLILLGLVAGEHELSAAVVGELLVLELAGGVVMGLLLGWLAYWLLKRIDNYQLEILITLAVAAGGYSVSESLHVSAPIAIVIAGLMVGNQGRLLAMSDKTRRHLDDFWSLTDEMLNAILFVLIGLEILILEFTVANLVLAGLMIPLVLLARGLSIAVPIKLMQRYRDFSPHIIKILTWSGLRGGISIALALSLPAGPERELILVLTYAVVIFSILVQGLSVGAVIRACGESSSDANKVSAKDEISSSEAIYP